MNDLETPVPFGRYELLRRIAVGGMAEVWLARAADGGGKPLVLKRILPQFAGDPEFVARFRQEASLTLTLVHGNVVPVFEIGAVGTDPYIAMEYVPGVDLRSVMRRANERGVRLPAGVAVWIVAELLRGLDYAHRKCGPDGAPLKLVHRDVSPSNVVISTEGAVKLVDFGIAKAIGVAEATRTGVLLGKAGYMSPEQARGDAIGPASDLFSAGVILWELLVGERLFDGDSEPAVLERVKSAGIPALRDRRPDAPEELDRILRRALARETSARVPDAATFLAELSRFLWSAEDAGAAETAAFVRKLFPEDAAGHAALDERTATHAASATETRGQGGRAGPALLLGGLPPPGRPVAAGANGPVASPGPAQGRAPAGRTALWAGAFVVAIAAGAALTELARSDRGAPGNGSESAIADAGAILVVTRNALGARVLLDGEDTGRRTPALLKDVKSGTHTVRVELVDYQPIEERVQVRAGQTVQIDQDLVPVERVLRVESAPPGALVTIESRSPQPPCTTPCSFRGLRPSETVVLTASLAGHRSVPQHVRVADREEPVRLVLEPVRVAAGTPRPAATAQSPGRLSFRVHPGWAWLSIDGGAESDKPLIDVPLEPGDHELRIRADDGRFDLRCAVRVPAGADVTLAPLDATRPQVGCPTVSGG